MYEGMPVLGRAKPGHPQVSRNGGEVPRRKALSSSFLDLIAEMIVEQRLNEHGLSLSRGSNSKEQNVLGDSK